jgi:hypothetical protein
MTQSRDEHEGLSVETGRLGSEAEKVAKLTDAQPNPPLSLASRDTAKVAEAALFDESPAMTAAGRGPEGTWSMAVAAPSIFARDAVAPSKQSGTRATRALRWDLRPTCRT